MCSIHAKNMQDKVSLNQEIDMNELAQIHEINKENAKGKAETVIDENTSTAEVHEEKANLKWNSQITQDQIDEMKAEGIKPGDQEYYQYLANIGIKMHNTARLLLVIDTDISTQLL